MSLTTSTIEGPHRSLATALRLVGAALLLTTGAIHLDLYLTGYRHIPTIGTLFLLQVLTSAVLGLATLTLARRVVALMGAGFALSTLVGYVLSLWFGLFGFHEVRTSAGAAAAAVELAAFATLGAYALFLVPRPFLATERVEVAVRRAFGPLGALAVLVLVASLANAHASSNSSATPPSSGPSSASTMKVTIKNFLFAPATFSVSPGESIVVTNVDSAAHTFTSVPGATARGTFDSGTIAPGKSVTVVAPMTAGSYPFYCSIHNFMTGTLTVK